MYKRILFGHDGSALAEAAIPHVAAIARRSGAEVLLVHVVRPVTQEVTRMTPDTGWFPPSQLFVEGAQDAIAYERAAAVEKLQQAAATLRDLGVSSVRQTVIEGLPDDGILALAQNEHCDLIVIATRGHSGFRRMLQGSVAESVLLRAHSPVLIVGPHAASGRGGGDGQVPGQ